MSEAQRQDTQSIIIVAIFTWLIWDLFLAIKIVLFLIGQIVVPISLFWNPRGFWLWDNDEKGFRRHDFQSNWDLYVDRAWRNASGNTKYVLEKIFGDPKVYIQRGQEIDESVAGFQWRYRQVKFLNSFRFVIGKPRAKKGKQEFYGGFKIGSNVPGFGFTLQARPFFLALIPLIVVHIPLFIIGLSYL